MRPTAAGVTASRVATFFYCAEQAPLLRPLSCLHRPSRYSSRSSSDFALHTNTFATTVQKRQYSVTRRPEITMSAPQKIAGDAQSIGKFLDNYDTFLFDCDGVLWSGNKLFDRTVETLEMLRSKGKKLVFVTNNSSKCRSDYKKKLDSLGIPATVEDIFPSSYSSAIYISRILNLPPKKNKVFVIGKSGIEQELEAEGVRYIGGTDPAYNREITAEDYDKIATGDPSILDPEVGVVLVGLDWNANYLKHSLAYHYILRGAHFLATNLDPTFPSHGTFFPGAGTCSAPLVTMLKGQQPISLGKPSQAMMDAIEGKFKLDRARTVMVGDRMDTDIKFGIEGGLGGTLAVLTGVSSEEEVLSSASKPKYYVNTLSDLLCGQE